MWAVWWNCRDGVVCILALRELLWDCCGLPVASQHIVENGVLMAQDGVVGLHLLLLCPHIK